MLPSILSEHLCSLVPRQDRLAFSVVLTVDETGEVSYCLLSMSYKVVM